LADPKKPVDLLNSLAAIAANNKQEEVVMGLDMVAYTARKASVSSEVDFTVEAVEADSLRQLYYWRKHHRLHDWMQRLYVAKGGQNPDFNVASLALNSADLDALEMRLRGGRPLPRSRRPCAPPVAEPGPMMCRILSLDHASSHAGVCRVA
jgi:hypothetical protein